MPLSTHKDPVPVSTGELIAGAGKRLMIGIKGHWPDHEETEFLKVCQPGGVILFSRNIKDIQQTSELIKYLKEICRPPFVIGVDQEGGAVARFVDGVTQSPSPMGLAASGKNTLVSKLSAQIAGDLRKIGIDLNLAPVVDINVKPENPGIGCRSFSDDILTVSKLSASTVKGFHKGGVAACAKHFPGKGRAWVDAHIDLPLIDRGMPEMLSEELVPFTHSIKAGVKFIMTSHVVVPWLSGDSPVTLVDFALSALLRHRMKYKGLIITDDLMMGALKSYDPDDIVKLAACSHDMLMICSSLDRQKQALRALEEGYSNGEISVISGSGAMFRINKYLPWASSLEAMEQRDEALEYKAALSSCTLVRDLDKMLPLKGDVLTICTDFIALTKVEDAVGSRKYLREMLIENGITGDFIESPISPDDELIDDLVSRAEKADKCLLITANAHLIPQQEKLAMRLLEHKVETIAVAVRNPYDLSCFAKSPAVLLTFGFRKPSLRAMARVLSGQDKARGIVPVNI